MISIKHIDPVLAVLALHNAIAEHPVAVYELRELADRFGTWKFPNGEFDERRYDALHGAGAAQRAIDSVPVEARCYPFRSLAETQPTVPFERLSIHGGVETI